MAGVFQLIATNKDDANFEEALIDGVWHFALNMDCMRTACGVQLDGDDGYAAGPSKAGRVTCKLCRSVINQVRIFKE